MNKKSILIVGGTGFIGYHLILRCLKLNWLVTSLSTNLPKKIRYHKKVNYIIGDISNYKLLKKKLKTKFDYVVNLGGYVDHSNKKKTYQSHFVGVKNLAKIFQNKKINNFIQVGSGGEYGKKKSPQIENFKGYPASVYYKSKLMATNFLLNLYNKKYFPVTILRFYQVYGPKQDTNRLISVVINNCLNDREFNCTNGKQYRDFIYIDDAINAIIKTLKSKKSLGQIFNVGLGKTIKIRELINYINKKIGKGKPLFGSIKMRKDEMISIYPSINKIKKILKWEPVISLKTGLEKTILYYKQNAKNF